MTVPLIVHVSAATLALVSGYISLGVGKGGALHRRSGLVFTYSMVVMGLLGTGIAIYRVTQGSTKPALHGTVLMGVFVAYLVVTALTTVRPPSVWSQRLERIGMPIALVCVALLVAARSRFSWDRAASFRPCCVPAPCA